MNPQMEQQSFSLRGRVFLRWTHWFLFIAGAVTLAWVALSLFQARLYQQSAGSALDAQVLRPQRLPRTPPATRKKFTLPAKSWRHIASSPPTWRPDRPRS